MEKVSIEVKRALFESKEMLERMEFVEISDERAKELLIGGDLWTIGLENGKKWNWFNWEQKAPYYEIQVDGKVVGVISFDTFQKTYWDSGEPFNIRFLSEDDPDILDHALWIKLLEVFSNKTAEQLMTILEKIEHYARENDIKFIVTSAKDERVKRVYMRGGFIPLVPFRGDDGCEMNEYREFVNKLTLYKEVK